MGSTFSIIFIIVVGYIIYSLISRYIKNENSPIIATKARLSKKLADVQTNTDANGAISTSETLYLIYELDTGSEIKLIVNGRIYRNAPENEWGTLTFQGTRFIKFESISGVLEKI
ncbi:MAG: DUF2500 domain-containing protein [Oscillospiraceae bacterium]|nr:DUF2500 domain-containing protein [Oscillospiraceae bacterium]